MEDYAQAIQVDVHYLTTYVIEMLIEVDVLTLVDGSMIYIKMKKKLIKTKKNLELVQKTYVE